MAVQTSLNINNKNWIEYNFIPGSYIVKAENPMVIIEYSTDPDIDKVNVDVLTVADNSSQFTFKQNTTVYFKIANESSEDIETSLYIDDFSTISSAPLVNNAISSSIDILGNEWAELQLQAGCWYITPETGNNSILITLDKQSVPVVYDYISSAGRQVSITTPTLFYVKVNVPVDQNEITKVKYNSFNVIGGSSSGGGIIPPGVNVTGTNPIRVNNNNVSLLYGDIFKLTNNQLDLDFSNAEWNQFANQVEVTSITNQLKLFEDSITENSRRINSNESNINTNTTDINSLKNTAQLHNRSIQANSDRINVNESRMGDLTGLNTTAKDSLVNAINEVNLKEPGVSQQDFNNLKTNVEQNTGNILNNTKSISLHQTAIDLINKQMQSKANDNEVVKLTTDQEIDGNKKFLKDIILANNALISNDSNGDIKLISSVNGASLLLGDTANHLKLNMQGESITGLKDPANASDATNKKYVDDKHNLIKTELDELKNTTIPGLETKITDNTNTLNTLSQTVNNNTNNIQTNTNDINALNEKLSQFEGRYVILGKIEKSRVEVNADKNLLTQFVKDNTKPTREPLKGDVIYTNDNYKFMYNGTEWVDLGIEVVDYASTTQAGIVKLKDMDGYLINDGVIEQGLVKVKGFQELKDSLNLKADKSQLTTMQQDIDSKATKVELNALSDKVDLKAPQTELDRLEIELNNKGQSITALETKYTELLKRIEALEALPKVQFLDEADTIDNVADNSVGVYKTIQ